MQSLTQASQSISDSIAAAKNIAQYAVTNAANGEMIQYGATDSVMITSEQMTAYNSALDAVSQAVYYNAKNLFEDKHQDSMQALGAAVDTFTSAAAEIAFVSQVNEIAQVADTVPEKEAVQSFIADNDVQLTNVQVEAYNTSIKDIEVNAQEAAAYLRASQDDRVLAIADTEAESFNASLHNSTVSYSASNDVLSVHFFNHSVELHGFINHTPANVLLGNEPIYLEESTSL